jgi:hypothetical protein
MPFSGPYWSPNVAAPFIDHSSEIWKFRCDGFLHPLSPEKGEAMRKTLLALAAVATLAISAVASPAHAQRGFGAGLAAGIIGGAIVGGAIAGPGYYYGPGYGYGYGPGYGYYAGGYGGCYWSRQRFWDGYGWRFRRVRVCG